MGQWLSCAALTSSHPTTSTPSSRPSAPTKCASLKTPACTAINRRAVGTESTLVDSATNNSVTAFPLSTTDSFASSHLSISPPHHRRYLSAVSSLPSSASTTASPPPVVCSPPPHSIHMRSSSASSCLSVAGLASVVQDVYPTTLMTRTSSHVDDIIEEVEILSEVVEPTPSPPSPPYTPPAHPHVRSTKPSIEQQQMEETEEAVGEVRCASLSPLDAPRVLSPRSVLAFMIVSNGGECETADEGSWEDEVEEMEEEDEEDEVGGLSMRDILASLPKTSIPYSSPFPSATASYLPSASSLYPSSRYASTSLSYPSMTALARRTLRSPQHEQQHDVEQADVQAGYEDEVEYEEGGHWCDDDSCVATSTRSISAAPLASVVSGL